MSRISSSPARVVRPKKRPPDRDVGHLMNTSRCTQPPALNTCSIAAKNPRECPLTVNLFSLSGVSLKDVARRVWAEILDDDVFGRAAQLAYYFFLALIPFLIFVIASLSVFGTADRGRALLFRFFADALPPAAFELIDMTFGQIIHASGPLKMSFGILASLWSASMGMSAIMDTLNAAYKVKETRSMIKQYAVATGLTVGIALLVVMSVVIAVFGDTIVNALSPGNMLTIMWKIAQWPLALALILLAFAITYYFAPNLRDRRWHWVTPGSIVGVILWLVVSLGLRIYLHFFGNYSVGYGSLGAVIVLLLWFYLSGIAVLSGAVVNGVLEGLAAPASVAQEAGSSSSKAA
jgi:membrane protein